ncbi:MAG TPA: AAA family ATPase [Patescibacteria group bacterium]
MPKSLTEEVVKLEKKVLDASLPEDLKNKLKSLIEILSRMASSGSYSSEYEGTSRYVDWIVNLPWKKRSKDILDLKNAKSILDKNHYGLTQLKDRILEYLAVLSLREKEGEVSRAPILCLVGLVGTGKTTLAYSIAESMGRSFARIPFGGMGDALQLRGQSRAFGDAEPGQIIKALRRGGSKNPVILLDEIDRVAESTRSDIMGVLIELLDPEQNSRFTDHYIDYPFDLSEVLFIATANNTTNISTAVLDRLEPISMPSYTDEEKITIGKDYLLPKALKESGLTGELLKIDPDVWPKIVRPLGFDAGMRSLERTIQGMCRLVARKIVEEGNKQFLVNAQNVKDFLPTW